MSYFESGLGRLGGPFQPPLTGCSKDDFVSGLGGGKLTSTGESCAVNVRAERPDERSIAGGAGSGDMNAGVSCGNTADFHGGNSVAGHLIDKPVISKGGREGD